MELTSWPISSLDGVVTTRVRSPLEISVVTERTASIGFTTFLLMLKGITMRRPAITIAPMAAVLANIEDSFASVPASDVFIITTPR